MSTAVALNFNDVSNILLDSPKENVTIDGITFNVPEGFTEIENESYDNQKLDNPYIDVNISSKAYVNASGDVIILSVSSSTVDANDTFAKDAAGENGNETAINGVEGYESSDDDFQYFSFAKDGKLVIISSQDKQLFNDIIVA